MKKLVIFGTGKFAEVVRYYFDHDSDYKVVAHSVDRAFLEKPIFQGLPVVAFEEVAQSFPPENHWMFIAVGSQQVNQLRASKYEAAAALGYELASYISSRATVFPDLVYGPNSLVVEGSLLGPFVQLGRSVFVLGSRIHHHCAIGDHCTLAEATLAGGVAVGSYSFIGLNALVHQNVTIGVRNVIGSGVHIHRSTKDHEVYRLQATKPSSISSTRLAELAEDLG